VPGASDQIGYGHVQDWPGLGKSLSSSGADTDTVPAQVWRLLRESEQRSIVDAGDQLVADTRASDSLFFAINRIVRYERLVPPAGLDLTTLPASVQAVLQHDNLETLTPHQQAHLNRWLLVSALPDVILPPPP